MKPQEQLLMLLAKKQGNASDLSFGKRIGLSRQMWQAIRTGKNVISAKVMAGIVAAYPDLWYAGAKYLLGKPPKRTILARLAGK